MRTLRSRWFRLVDTRNATGTAVMQGPDDKPLLLLAREGEGRVALLLSDHIWLWARGYEGGGPHLDLLRRLSHWLMKQPDLEEEALRLVVHGRELVAWSPFGLLATAAIILARLTHTRLIRKIFRIRPLKAR